MKEYMFFKKPYDSSKPVDVDIENRLFNSYRLEEVLNIMAAEGWELHSFDFYSNRRIIFVREKK